MGPGDPTPTLFPIRAVIDSNVFPHTRAWMKPLEGLARDGFVRLFWSPWIISEVNRVLTWHWIRRHRGDTSNQAWARCSEQAKGMFAHATRMLEVVEDRPPYPAIWSGLPNDVWDVPIFAAAKHARASVVVTENIADAPPLDGDLRVWDKVAYLHPTQFLSFVGWAIDEVELLDLPALDEASTSTVSQSAREAPESPSDALLLLLRTYLAVT